MSMFYAGRHRAPSTKSPHRAGASMVAVAAVSLGTAAATAPGASAAPSAVSAPAAASVSSATSATTFSGLVKRGHRGSLVKQVQRKVGVSADGVFGPMTQSAVKRYQKRNGLVADGIVGPRTGTKMGLRSTSTVSSRTTTRSSVSTSSVLSTAASLVGTPYVYGGTSRSGWDCSGFTQYVFAKAGKSLPRVTTAQQAAATPVSNPQPGDLVFFGSPSWHVGIYVGDGMMIDAPRTGKSISIRPIFDGVSGYGRV